MPIRAIRGAITIKKNNRKEIFQATQQLLLQMQKANQVKTTDIVSIFLTMTPDLNADFPAYAAREMGWIRVPLLCAAEINVPGAMKKVIRALMHVNTSKKQHQIKHQYLGQAAKLRPDLQS